MLGLGEGELHLWCARLEDLDDTVFPRYEALLSESELDRCRAFRFERHRREYLLTRALVRTALSHYLPLAPDEWRFRHNAYGKPAADPPCGLGFNLSNSCGLVACLLASGREVGVDVEPCGRADSVLAVAAEVFSVPELAQLHALAGHAQARRGLALWTLKEAYIKARGMGLSLPLKEFSFLFDEAGAVRLALNPVLADDPGHWRFGLIGHAGHCIAWMAEHLGPAPLRLTLREAKPLLENPKIVLRESFGPGYSRFDPGGEKLD